MNSAPHRIRSLRWQVGAGSTAEAFHWRALLREKGTELLLPVLERELNEIASGDRIIHIPRIELKARLGSEEELETMLSGELLHQLKEQLQRLSAGGWAAGQTPAKEEVTAERNRFDILLHYLQTGILPWRAANFIAPDLVITSSAAFTDDSPQIPEHTEIVEEDVSAERNRFDMLLRYMKTGAVPRQAASLTSSDQAAALGNTCHDEWRQLLEYLKVTQEDPPFYFRLLQLLSKEQSALLIRALSGVIPHESGAALMQCLTLLLDDDREPFSHHTRLSLMAGILAESSRWRPNSASLSLLKVATAAVPPRELHLLERFVAGLPVTVARLFRRDDTSMANWKPEPVSGADAVELPDSPRPEPRTKDIIFAHPGVFTKEAENPPAPLEMGRQSNSGLFPMLIQQAGLVLLHPYIARFFENCGIKDAGVNELNSFAMAHAAALLHFLATGREELYEYELGLIKIMLGLHPETPLPVCAGLITPDDIEETEALLQSVISHWSILKNSSIQGVRSAFIERQGLVREEEDGWRLNVERKPYDMLIDQIPWSIGIVKLPWMQKAIFTEW